MFSALKRGAILFKQPPHPCIQVGRHLSRPKRRDETSSLSDQREEILLAKAIMGLVSILRVETRSYSSMVDFMSTTLRRKINLVLISNYLLIIRLYLYIPCNFGERIYITGCVVFGNNAAIALHLHRSANRF